MPRASSAGCWSRKPWSLAVNAKLFPPVDTPNGPWMEQIARNVSGERGFLAGKKYLIYDRDPPHTARFKSILKTAGVEPAKLPRVVRI